MCCERTKVSSRIYLQIFCLLPFIVRFKKAIIQRGNNRRQDFVLGLYFVQLRLLLKKVNLRVY